MGFDRMAIWREVYPLGRSFGLIQGNPDAACEALYRELRRSTVAETAEIVLLESFAGPQRALELLEPLSMPFEDRFLVLGCPGDWSLYLDNSALCDASPPRLADLARSQARSTIHVTITSEFDRTGWRFYADGTPYPFEDRLAYSAEAGEERFTREHLRHFLASLGVVISNDSLIALEPDASGHALALKEADPAVAQRLRYITLQELRHSPPWSVAR
jgi:hypothetical protein